MTLKKTFVATTALVLCVSASFARQETMPVSANAQFISWYGGLPAAGVKYRLMPRDGNTVLYEQSASSGFSTYAISSWGVSGSAACSGCWDPMAADDFIVPGTGRYKITAVYAPGVILSGAEPSYVHIVFYDALRYSKKTGKTTIAIKAACDTSSYSDTSGHGDFLVDVLSCNLGRRFRADTTILSVSALVLEQWQLGLADKSQSDQKTGFLCGIRRDRSLQRVL
jgi:hypothetical protein